MKNQKGVGLRINMFFLNNKAFLLMVLMAAVSVILTNGLAVTPYNLSGIARQIAVLAIVSIGYTVILGSGQIDLSVGEIIALCGIVYAMLSKVAPLAVAIFAALMVGLVCEFVNGFVIRMFKLPGFVLTLAMGQIYKGITHIITDGKSVGGLGASVKYLGQGQVLGVIPMPFIIMFAIVILIAILLNQTIYGRQLIATGGNAEAAEVSGIKTNRIRITAHMIGGICFAMGAVVLTGRVATAITTAGDGYSMDAIAAVVIGGTPMSGGKAKVIGTLFGVGLIGIINNMLNLCGVSAYWQWVCKGIIIFVAILLDSMTERALMKQRSMGVI